MSTRTAEAIPRSALIGVATLLGATLLVATVVRVTGADITQMPPPVAVSERLLRFVDEPGGRVRILDGTTGVTITELVPGEDGFVRSTMRSLVRDRRARGLGADVPFRLVAGDGGRLALQDPATGRSLELEAFGPTNAGRFARLLPAPGDHR